VNKGGNASYSPRQHRRSGSESTHAEDHLRLEFSVERAAKGQAFVKAAKEPKNAGENGEGSPTVGNLSTRKFVCPETARASMSFSEINSITSWPRSRSTSATAMPGKR